MTNNSRQTVARDSRLRRLTEAEDRCADDEAFAIYINNTILTGFAGDHIARVAESVAPALRVQVQTAWGPLIPTTLIIRLQVGNGVNIQDLAVLGLPMGQTEEPMYADCFRLAERLDVWQPFPELLFEPVGVSHSRYRNQDLVHFRGVSSPPPAWSLARRTTPDLIRLEAMIEVDKIAVSYPAKFRDRIDSEPAGLGFIASRLKSTFDAMKPEGNVSMQFVIPYTRGWEGDWYVFLTDQRKMNPGVLDLPALCNGRIEDLDYSKKLIVHQWFDMAVYGMNGTRLPTAYLMAVNMSYFRDVYIRELAQRGYTLPRPPLSDSNNAVGALGAPLLPHAVRRRRGPPTQHPLQATEHLRKREGENGDDHHRRILAWLREALLRDWPRSLRKPPMVVEAPEMSPVTDLQGFPETAFADSRDVLRAEICYSVDQGRDLEEPEAIPIVNNVDFNAG
ncbi:hypothetical protein J3F83DRAFT_761839 [Trichoderma novae-zelandiae]